MSYRFKSDESIREGVRRVVANQIEAAEKRLADRTGDMELAVHAVRKSVKKIRAVVKLIKPELGTAYRAENRTWRDIGRPLSKVRDAAVLVESLDGLCQKYAGQAGTFEAVPIREVLVNRKQEAYSPDDLNALIKKTMHSLQKAEKRVKSWPLRHADFTLIEGGFEDAYRRGEKALARVRKDPSPENYHELRKRVKDHWYHVRLLEGVWPEMMEPFEKTLNDLQEWLGEDHNLTVLRATVTEVSDGKMAVQEVESLTHLIEKYQSELRDRSVAVATRVYAENPRPYTMRIRRWWEASQTHPNELGATKLAQARATAQPSSKTRTG